MVTDNAGGRRFKIVGVGATSASRVSIQTSLGALHFDGIRTGGEFAFLRPQQPLGFVTGLVSAPGAGAQSLALVTTDTAPFAFVTTTAGTFVVAGRVGVPTAVAAIEPAGATASSTASLAALNDIATVNLLMVQTAPAATSTSPVTGAVNVALDAPIVVDFSKSIDPATVPPSSVVLRAGQTVVSAVPTLSANRRRLTVTPSAPLLGLTIYSVTLTSSIHDLAGVPLSPFAPLTFTTLDSSKATVLALGVITAELPDEDGMSLITGAPGASEPGAAVVATNLRTQETAAVISLPDGGFRLRVGVVIGDEVAITIRDLTGRQMTLAITQFASREGTTSIGSGGGTIIGVASRIGRVLPRALGTAGLFKIEDGGVVQSPALPSSFAIVDRFAMQIEGAAFKRLDSLTLTEGQGRFPPATAQSAPFAASGQLTVPPDFLVTASVRFAAVVADRDGATHSTSGATVVVTASPDTPSPETGFGDEFPTVFLTAPREAIPNQVISVSAVAPAARVDLDLASNATLPSGQTAMLTRIIEVNGESLLSLVDRFAPVDVGGVPRLRTVGRNLPGATRSGDYAVAAGPVAFVTGRASGPAALVTADGLPFVFETEGANGFFIVPVLADAAFSLRFVDLVTGTEIGTATGHGPNAGAAVDIGHPLTNTTEVLTVSAQPDSQSVVEIGTPIVFSFSTPLDPSTVTPNAFVVTDPSGVRQFGRLAVSADGRTVTFVPARRWKFGTRYRYGVATSVVAMSGARLAQPFDGQFITFAPSTISAAAVGTAFDTAVAGSIAVVGTASGAAILDVASPRSPQMHAQIPLPGGARGVVVLPSHTLTNRQGQAVSGTFAVIVSGDATTGGRLQLFDISEPSSPVLIGSAQLTAAPGQTPPAGVPARAGTPRRVRVTTDNRALVAVEGVGLVSVSLGQTIPNDPANPGQALGPRYPAAGDGDISGVALLGDRVVLAGAEGLTVLNAGSLERLDSLPTDARLLDVDALASFGLDLNGDGSTLENSEVFDLAVATSDGGTLQFFRVPNDDHPELLTVVRLPGAVTGVALHGAEKLAYVGVGPLGIASVDLDGPASIQPLDVDRNGADDRILHLLDTPATAIRPSLVLERGLGFVADGSGGLLALQLLPPRSRFTTLLRDPVTVVPFDEQSIAESLTAYLTDDALRVTLDVSVPPSERLVFVVEGNQSAGTPSLTLTGGGLATALSDGINSIDLFVAHDAGAPPQSIRLGVRTATGAMLASRTVRLVPADPGLARLKSVRLGPTPIILGAAAPAAQLGVAGFYDDGKILNLTQPGSGTTYQSERASVATVDPSGGVSGVAGGIATVTASNGSVAGSVQVRVNMPAVLTALEASTSHLTFRSLGDAIAFPVCWPFLRWSSRTGRVAIALVGVQHLKRGHCHGRGRRDYSRGRRRPRTRVRLDEWNGSDRRGGCRSSDSERDCRHLGSTGADAALAGSRAARGPGRSQRHGCA